LSEPGSLERPTSPRRVSVVIATRDRGSLICSAIDSILSQTGLEFEIIVVDSSVDGATLGAMPPYLSRGNVRYFRIPAQGLSVSRNFGVRVAGSDVIAMTDDDCLASPGWLAAITAPLRNNPRIAAVYGNTVAVPHDRDLGFVIAYTRLGSFLASSMRQKHHLEGIGACMAVRRQACQEIGGFDPLLGAGARFHAAEEVDLTIRALQAGYFVFETDQAEVVHTNFRPNSQRNEVSKRYLFGIAAVYAKHLRCGRLSVLIPLVALAARWVFSKPVVSYGHPPSRGSRLAGFCGGFLAAFRAPVNRKAAVFKS
jgi:glycosyltransferase involved in cell wall biosynthesis